MSSRLSSRIVLLPLALTGLQSCAQARAVEEARPLSVGVETLHWQPSYERVRRFPGRIQSLRGGALGFERGGKVQKVYVREGSRVRRGQCLARLDTGLLKAQEAQLEASRQGADASSQIASLSAGRVSRLAAERFESLQASDEARLGAQAAGARVQELEAALSAVRVQLRQSQLIAPFDGTIAERLVDEGTIIAAGSAAFRFLEDARYQAEVGLPLASAQGLSPGEPLDLEIGGARLRGSLASVVRDLDAATRTAKVLVDLADDRGLTPGENASLLLRRRVEERGFWMPLSALREGIRGLWSVFVLRSHQGKERIERVDVEVLHQEQERVYLRGGLREGERIVSEGGHKVVPGQIVRASQARPVAGGAS